jgi:hypothetical protein
VADYYGWYHRLSDVQHIKHHPTPEVRTRLASNGEDFDTGMAEFASAPLPTPVG